MMLYYFNIRGLGEMARITFSLAGEEWTETEIEYAKMKEDATLYPYGQCPVLRDGDAFITQSLAILNYIGRKHGLVGGTNLEQTQIESLIHGVTALRGKYLELIYEHQLAPEKMDACWEMHCNPATARVGNRNGGAHWKYISEALTAHRPDGKGAAVGETRTTGDVVLFEVLDLYLRIFPKQMKASYPELAAFHADFAEVPAVAAYLKSDKRPKAINANSLG